MSKVSVDITNVLPIAPLEGRGASREPSGRFADQLENATKTNASANRERTRQDNRSSDVESSSRADAQVADSQELSSQDQLESTREHDVSSDDKNETGDLVASSEVSTHETNEAPAIALDVAQSVSTVIDVSSAGVVEAGVTEQTNGRGKKTSGEVEAERERKGALAVELSDNVSDGILQSVDTVHDSEITEESEPGATLEIVAKSTGSNVKAGNEVTTQAELVPEETTGNQSDVSVVPGSVDGRQTDAQSASEEHASPAQFQATSKELSGENSEDSQGQDQDKPDRLATNETKVKPATVKNQPIEFELESSAKDKVESLHREEIAGAETSLKHEGAPPERTENASPLSRIAAGSFATSRGESTQSNELPRVDASRFTSRVSGAVKAAQQRGGEIKLRLSPPELGSLQIKLTMSEGVMTASLETETAAAKNLLLDNLPALRERLAEQEIRVDKFDVDVRQEGKSQEDWAAGERGKNKESQQDDKGEPSDSGRGSTGEEDRESSASQVGTIGTDEINLVA